MKATYDLWLVALSITMAVIASYAATFQARRLSRAPVAAVRNWGLLGVAVTLSVGVWSTYFIGFLAYSLPTPPFFDLTDMGLSFGTVFLASGGAFLLARQTVENPGRLWPGVILMASGMVATHYIGLSTMRMDPPLSHDPVRFVISCAISLLAAYLVVWLAYCAPKMFDSIWIMLGSAVFMGVAISGVHYAAMSGTAVADYAQSLSAPMGITRHELEVVTICSSSLVIFLSLFFSIVKPLFAVWRLVALLLLGESAVMLLTDRVFPDIEGFVWMRSFLGGLLFTLFLSPLLFRLRRDSLSLAYERARASTALASIGDGVIVTDASGCVEFINAVAEDLTGWRLADARGKHLGEVFHILGEDDRPIPSPVEDCIRLNRIVDLSERTVLVSRDGVRLGIEDSAAPIHDEKGETAGAVLVFRDVTVKRKAEDELNLSASVFSHAPEGIVITDRNAHILRVNKAFSAITGYSPNEIIGRNPRILASGKHDKSFYQGMWERLETVGEWQGEVWNRRKNGEVYPEWLSIRAIHSERGERTHYVGIFSDISERIRNQEYIFRLAYYDSLTSVANRALLMDHLEMAIAQARRHQMAVAVLFIDMDRFKLINDSLGHSVGDLLLQNVAQALTSSVRDGDTVSRFGGDEFVICLQDVNGNRADATRDSFMVAEKIQRRLSQPFNLQGHEVAITPSIGVAIYPWDGETPVVLIKNADTAMYHAKAQGRDNVQLFSEEMLYAGSERLRIQSALRRALESEEFIVYYQAQLELATGRIVGAEALLRWNNPELGSISPVKFIPIAEDTSLILPIGDWVLRQVCRDWKVWKERFGGRLTLPRIALNFSPRQFIQPDLVGRIMNELNESGVSPDCIEVEITEATLMHNTNVALNALNQLRDKGIRVAVDDFGVGYSSLSYLKKFPIDVLKIDQSFIRDISTDSNDEQIICAIIAMGHSLNLTVLAEGVETMEQAAFLRKEGCQKVQGFLFSHPIPADQFADLLLREGNDIAAPVKDKMEAVKVNTGAWQQNSETE